MQEFMSQLTDYLHSQLGGAGGGGVGGGSDGGEVGVLVTRLIHDMDRSGDGQVSDCVRQAGVHCAGVTYLCGGR